MPNSYSVFSVASSISVAFSEMISKKGSVLLVIKIAKGARKDLGRPTTTPKENKQNFMQFLKG